MRTFNIYLCENENYSVVGEIIECCFNKNKDAIHYAVDKLLESPKKYKCAFLIDNKDKNLIRIER